MAEVRPFKGIRYNESVVGGLEKTVSPPYDIISPEERLCFHQIHPNNFVRLILGEEYPEDNESNNRFTRAGNYLNKWISDGVFKQDREPAIYVYRQQFERDGQQKSIRGLMLAAKIHEYADKVILPHENTLAKPKSQLIELIRQTKANLDCVYGLYADEEGVLDVVMDRAMEKDVVADVSDRDGVRHTLWAVTDAGEIGIITGYLSDKQIAIADGHHRYETALAYRNEMRKKQRCENCELASDYVMMTITNVHQKDMTIDPTHRVVGNLPDGALENIENSLSELFEIAESSKESLIDDMKNCGAIGMYAKGSAKTLKLKGDPGKLLSGSEASRKLELNVLHKLILEPQLGIDESKLRDQTHIIYTRDPEEAMALVDSGERQAAFFINNIDVKAVLDIASAGDRMPQKATYFYPKLLSGLVLRKMD